MIFHCHPIKHGETTQSLWRKWPCLRNQIKHKLNQNPSYRHKNNGVLYSLLSISNLYLLYSEWQRGGTKQSTWPNYPRHKAVTYHKHFAFVTMCNDIMVPLLCIINKITYISCNAIWANPNPCALSYKKADQGGPISSQLHEPRNSVNHVLRAEWLNG